MSQASIMREPKVIREEIRDLSAYLDELPAKLRDGGAFAAYERRMTELNSELILSQLLRFYQSQKSIFEKSITTSSKYEQTYQAVEQGFRQLEQEHKLLADRYARITRALQYLMIFVGLAAIITDSLGSNIASDLLLMSGAIVVVISVSFFFLFKKVRKEERLADYYMALSDAVVHTLTSSGKIINQPHYYEISSKRIDELIDRIRAEPRGAAG